MRNDGGDDLLGAGLLCERLGERLALERQGTRLYGALLDKIDRLGTWAGGPTHGEVSHLRLESCAHVATIEQALRNLGRDPAETATRPRQPRGLGPAGILGIVTDPHTTSAQALHAILFAELHEDACWQLLLELCATLGHEGIADSLRGVYAGKSRIVDQLRLWLLRAVAPQPTVHA